MPSRMKNDVGVRLVAEAEQNGDAISTPAST